MTTYTLHLAILSPSYRFSALCRPNFAPPFIRCDRFARHRGPPLVVSSFVGILLDNFIPSASYPAEIFIRLPTVFHRYRERKRIEQNGKKVKEIREGGEAPWNRSSSTSRLFGKVRLQIFTVHDLLKEPSSRVKGTYTLWLPNDDNDDDCECFSF